MMKKVNWYRVYIEAWVDLIAVSEEDAIETVSESAYLDDVDYFDVVRVEKLEESGETNVKP